MASVRDVFDQWQQRTADPQQGVATADYINGARLADCNVRRSFAKEDAMLRGQRYEPPNCEDMGNTYINSLIMGDAAIEALEDDDQPQPPPRHQPRPRPANNWPWLLALTMLLSGGLIAWAIVYFADLYQPPPSPSFRVEFLQSDPTASDGR